MRKLVIKTVLITLLCLILIIGCLFGAFAIFSPKVIGNKAEKIGSYKVACWAYERQYEKDKTEDALSELNSIYRRYVMSLIDGEKYSKATDVTISAIEDKGCDASLFNLVKYELNLEKSKKNQTEKNIKTISSCLEKIEQSINN